MRPSSPKVLLVARHHPILIQELNKMGYITVFKEALPYTEALKEIAMYEGLVTSNHLPVDQPLITAGKQLKWIGRLGSGMEIIDTEEAQKRNIACFSTPAGNSNAVAEQALGMLLILKHCLFKAQNEISNHQWLREENRGEEISGKTAGIIGLGNNGSRLAQKLSALGMKVLVYDKYHNNYDMPGIIPCEHLEPIYEQAEVLSFHVPLNKETHYYFNHDTLAAMQHPFILLNLSRGPVVNQDALFHGLQTGKIKGAALDVWEEEPFWKHPDSSVAQQAAKLLKLPNFIGTPHIGGYTHDALYKMSLLLSEKIAAFLKR